MLPHKSKPPRGGGAAAARALAALLAVALVAGAWLGLPLLHAARLRLKIYRLYRAELPRYLPRMEASPTWQRDAVPPVVHFVVPNNASRWLPVWRQCHESWRQQLPGHRVRLWNDDDMERLVRDAYPQFLRVYRDYTRQIQRADMARYLILHHAGGVYADSDYQCVRGFAHLLPHGRVSLAESPHGGEVVQNALMASPQHHPFWAHVMRELLSNVYVEDVVLSTGPRALLYAFDKAPAGMVHLLPRDRFARWPNRRAQRARDSRDAAQMYAGADVYAIHLGTESWQ